jgi:hypothetical protein
MRKVIRDLNGEHIEMTKNKLIEYIDSLPCGYRSEIKSKEVFNQLVELYREMLMQGKPMFFITNIKGQYTDYWINVMYPEHREFVKERYSKLMEVFK